MGSSKKVVPRERRAFKAEAVRLVGGLGGNTGQGGFSGQNGNGGFANLTMEYLA